VTATRGRTGRAAIAASTLAAVVALVCATFVAPDADRYDVVDVERLTVAVAFEPREPELVPPVEVEVQHPTRASAPAPATPTAAHARAEARRIVRGLAAEIRSVGFDREAWIVQARATAATLAPATIDALEELAGEQGAGGELIATAELLRHRRDPGARATLPEAALEALRTAVDAPESAAAAAAARALAALGTDLDRSDYIDALARGAMPDERELAAWALRAAGGERVTHGLAEVVRAPLDERARDLALSTLAVLLSERDDLSPAARESARDALASALVDPRERTRVGAVVAMAALDDAAAGQPLLAVLTDPTRSPAVARAAAGALATMNDATVARDLALLVADPLLDETRRALVAETMLASRAACAAMPSARLEALDVLTTVARKDPNPAARRRAVWKLSSAHDLIAREALAEVASTDSDRGVRNAATRALQRLAQNSGTRR